MKNYEKYKEKIDKHDNPQCYVYYELMGNENCKNEGCSSGCFIKTIRWLLEEYIEPPKLSHDEYVILKNLPKEFEWIARDEDDDVVVYDNRPTKGFSSWGSTHDEINRIVLLMIFSHIFKFIKWEDEEPYSIQQLIADYEKEHEDGN